MKKPLLLLVYLLFACLLLHATVRTVSNFPEGSAQFKNIQEGVDASSDGDTVYVQGSTFQYAAFTITNKKLTIIGPGWAPLRKEVSLTSLVQGLNINGVLSSGSEIQGLVLNGNININQVSISSLKVLRNYFSYCYFVFNNGTAGSYNGYLFEGNFFNSGGIIGNNNHIYQNFLFQNNVALMLNNFGNHSLLYNFSKAVNFKLDHNLFYSPAGFGYNLFANCINFDITNNIFINLDVTYTLSTSSFSHNLTYNCVNNTPWAYNSNADAGGNIENQNPQIVDLATINSGSGSGLQNFTIPAGPANNSGTDNKDLGLLYDNTGSLNWTNSRMSRIPYMYSMQINNPTVAPNGNITVQVEARTNN